jgi:hypothetical protein
VLVLKPVLAAKRAAFALGSSRGSSGGRRSSVFFSTATLFCSTQKLFRPTPRTHLKTTPTSGGSSIYR